MRVASKKEDKLFVLHRDDRIPTNSECGSASVFLVVFWSFPFRRAFLKNACIGVCRMIS